jgi:branched-chain amino acid transport system substrate-binding protein
VKRWSGLIPDHEYGRSTWECFVDGLLTYGNGRLEILDPVLLLYGASDFKNNITASLRQNAEGLFVSVYGGDAVTMFQQARPFGLFQRAKAIIDSSNEFQVSAALKLQLPTQWTGLFWYPKAHEDNPLSRDLYAEFVRRTGKHYAGGWMSEAHSSVRAYARAIELAGGSLDVNTLIGKLKGLTWETVTGPRTMRAEDNQAVKDIELVLLKAADSELGADVADFVRIPGESVIEPPTPGKPLSFRRV